MNVFAQTFVVATPRLLRSERGTAQGDRSVEAGDTAVTTRELNSAISDAGGDTAALSKTLRDFGIPAEMARLIPRGASPATTIPPILLATKLFDEEWYVAHHPEVADTDQEPVTHFATIGWRSGFSPSFYFDPPFYVAQVPAEQTQGVNPLLHYLYVGEAKGLRPMPHFDPVWYGKHYEIVAQSPLCHYLRHLDARSYSPNAGFDVDYYLAAHADVRASAVDPLRHYVLFGLREGRFPRAGALPNPAAVDVSSPSETTAEPEAEPLIAAENDETLRLVLASGLLDTERYARDCRLPPMEADGLARHYLDEGAAAGFDPNPLFDTDWYHARHKDEIGALNPLVHYVTQGWQMRLDPHPLFSVRYYLDRNPDVLAANREPLAHYLETGGREGRSPCEEFDSAYYLDHYRDVAVSDQNPLVHFVEHGAAERRNPSAIFDTDWYVHNVCPDPTVNPLIHFRANGASVDRLRKLRLSHDYTMSDADLLRWTQDLADSLPTGAVAGKAASRLIVVRAGVSPASALKPQASEIDDMTWAEALKHNKRIASDPSALDTTFYLFCGATDAIDGRFVAPVLATMARGGLLGVFDLVGRQDDRWIVNLLAGANAAHLEAVDATFSRFLISARLMAAIAVSRSGTAHGILTKGLAWLRSHNSLSALRHAAFPLLKTDDLSDQIRQTRQRLADEAIVRRLRPTVQRASLSTSVVICTKDRGHLLSQLLDHLLRLPPEIVTEIVVVANPPSQSHARQVHAHYATKDRVVLLPHDDVYNFSVQCNRGARRCRGDLLLFLNDDIVPIGSNWLDELREPFVNKDVGITGPLLLYPDERNQHAGMYMGFNNCAGHTLRGARLPDEDYFFTASAPRNVTAVTGAAMLTPRPLFEQLNGFDRQLATYLQDVDYCLRVRNTDREIVFQPNALLFHMESVSMGDSLREPSFLARRSLEHHHFSRKWARAMTSDEFHNPNLEVSDESQRTLRRRPV